MGGRRRVGGIGELSRMRMRAGGVEWRVVILVELLLPGWDEEAGDVLWAAGEVRREAVGCRSTQRNDMRC